MVKKSNFISGIILIMVGISSISGCSNKGTNTEENIQMIGISLNEETNSPTTEFLGDFDISKEEPKFDGYITGKDIYDKEYEIRKDFNIKKISILGVEMEIPDFMQYVTPVISNGGAVNFVTKNDDINNIYNKNNLCISVLNNNDNLTANKYLESEQNLYNNLDELDKYTVNNRKLESYQIENNKLTLIYYINNNELDESDSSTEFNYFIYENNKIYRVCYTYQDSEIGNSVNKLIVDSFKIK